MVRLIRFQSKYGWDIPLSVLKTVKRNAERIQIVSSERIMGELEKVMAVGKLYQAIKLMKITGLLKYVLPEIEALKGVAQGKDHHSEGDVFKHTLLVLKNAPKTVEGQLAALLHDVGKAKTQSFLEDKIHFYKHDEVSAEMAEAILYRLKFDKKTIDRVVKLVREHMRPHSLENASPKAFRKLIRDMGEELTDVLLDLAEADSLGSYPIENVVPNLRQEIERIRKAPVKMEKKPVLGGQEIMDTLHIKPGPKVGEVGKFLIDLADEYAEQGKKLSKEEAKEIILKNYAA
jgi:putative nucleotidyltransferase with HDIG domain